MTDKLAQQVNGLRDLKLDWDSYGAEPPSSDVIEKLSNALGAIRPFFPPHHICASAEGGAAFCWFKKPKYADIEFLNAGEIVAVTSLGTGDDSGIRVWNVTDIEAAAREISTWMDEG